MEVSINWGSDKLHDGSGKCPADAWDVPCMVKGKWAWREEND